MLVSGESGNAFIEKICQVADVGVNDAGFYVDEKRLGVVERRVNSAGGARHLATEPTHINAEAGGPFAQHKIVSVNVGGRRIRRAARLGVSPEMTTAFEDSVMAGGAATRLVGHSRQTNNDTTTTRDIANARRLRIRSAKPKPG